MATPPATTHTDHLLRELSAELELLRAAVQELTAAIGYLHDQLAYHNTLPRRQQSEMPLMQELAALER
jgi:hypothetical protein